MKYSEDAVRKQLLEATLRLSKDPECPLSDEELLAKYLELAKDENIQWIRELLRSLDKAHKGKNKNG